MAANESKSIAFIRIELHNRGNLLIFSFFLFLFQEFNFSNNFKHLSSSTLSLSSTVLHNNMSINGPQLNHRNKRLKSEGDQNSKDDLGEYQGRDIDDQQQLHGRQDRNKQTINRICRDFVRGLCRRKYCRVRKKTFFWCQQGSHA